MTRLTGQIQTCSCGYGRLLDPSVLVEPEFCSMNDPTANYYNVNCVTDLDHNGGPVVSVQGFNSARTKTLKMSLLLKSLLKDLWPLF